MNMKKYRTNFAFGAGDKFLVYEDGNFLFVDYDGEVLLAFNENGRVEVDTAYQYDERYSSHTGLTREGFLYLPETSIRIGVWKKKKRWGRTVPYQVYYPEEWRFIVVSSDDTAVAFYPFNDSLKALYHLLTKIFIMGQHETLLDDVKEAFQVEVDAKKYRYVFWDNFERKEKELIFLNALREDTYLLKYFCPAWTSDKSELRAALREYYLESEQVKLNSAGISITQNGEATIITNVWNYSYYQFYYETADLHKALANNAVLVKHKLGITFYTLKNVISGRYVEVAEIDGKLYEYEMYGITNPLMLVHKKAEAMSELIRKARYGRKQRKTKEEIFVWMQANKDVEIDEKLSYAVWNCKPGTKEFMRKYKLPAKITVGELLEHEHIDKMLNNSNFLRVLKAKMK